MTPKLDKASCKRFLKNPNASDLGSAFWWERTPQGYLYWVSLYDDLQDSRPISPTRMDEAKRYIAGLIGEAFEVTLEEAEWE